MDPAPFMRGCAFPGTQGVPYPRAKADDAARLPGDTWATAQIPATVRIEISGSAEAVEIEYTTATDDMGYRGDGAGRLFDVWRDAVRVGSRQAVLGRGSVRIPMGEGAGRAIVYLPEGMKPTVTGIEPVGGSIEPPPAQPRWIAYGDSLAEGWVASGPSGAWPAIAGRDHGLDVVNMGYAGAARGEIVSAEQIADVGADVISITHGTNCWTRTPHSVGMFREGLVAFLDVVRQGHPKVPIIVATPVVRPDAETTANRLGATLADLRATMADAVRARIAVGDDRLVLLDGFAMMGPDQLADGVHPGDEGHQSLAAAIGSAVATAVRSMPGQPTREMELS